MGSLGGRAGGPGTAGLGKSRLAAVLVVVRLLEQKKGTRAQMCSVHKGWLAGAWSWVSQALGGRDFSLQTEHVRGFRGNSQSLSHEPSPAVWREASSPHRRERDEGQKVYPPEEKGSGGEDKT